MGLLGEPVTGLPIPQARRDPAVMMRTSGSGGLHWDAAGLMGSTSMILWPVIEEMFFRNYRPAGAIVFAPSRCKQAMFPIMMFLVCSFKQVFSLGSLLRMGLIAVCLSCSGAGFAQTKLV